MKLPTTGKRLVIGDRLALRDRTDFYLGFIVVEHFRYDLREIMDFSFCHHQALPYERRFDSVVDHDPADSVFVLL